MRKTIVLLLSLAVILGCMAVPVSAAKGFESRIINRYVTSEFHGITMKKLRLTFEFKGRGIIRTRLGFKKNGSDTLYGGKTTTTSCNSSTWNKTTKFSNLVYSSIGANTPYFQITII